MPFSNSNFENKLVVITGGTSGIGLALARELYSRNARIILLANKRAGVETAVQELGGRGERLEGYVCDVTIPESVAATGIAILSKHGVPDVLVNNAGFATYRTFEQEQPDEVERLASVNFAGALRVTKAFLGGMIERRSGHVINIASIAGTLTLTPNAVYCGAKHGMMAWSRCLAIETARYGIHVGIVCPGRVETKFFDHETFKARAHRKETGLTIPMPAVVDAILDTIVRRRKVRFVPRYFGLLAWAANAFGPLVRGQLDRLMAARVEDLYKGKSTK